MILEKKTVVNTMIVVPSSKISYIASAVTGEITGIVPNCDFPCITSQQQLDAFKRERTLDLRRMKSVSFLRSLDAEDSRMHKHEGTPYYIQPSFYQDMCKLYDVLAQSGYRNILFCKQQDLIDVFKLGGKRPNRDLHNKLESLKKKYALRYYTSEHGIESTYIKIVLNPLYGFVFQKDNFPPTEQSDVVTYRKGHNTSFYSVMHQAIHSFYKPVYSNLPSVISPT